MNQDMLDLVLLQSGKNSVPSDGDVPTTMSGEKNAAGQPSSCPVDHKTRDAWMVQARAAGSDAERPTHTATSSTPETPAPSSSWNWRIPFLSTSPSKQPQPSASSAQPPTAARPSPAAALGTDRVVSTIPRSSTPGPTSCPVNHEVETGADAKTGNWIYPSEKMFFEAMKRKGFDSTHAADMRTVVPIHNAVNERAWAEIKTWEAPYTGTGAGQ